MKNKIIALAFMFVLLMCGCSQIKTEHHALQNAREIYYSPTRVESYTYGDFDRPGTFTGVFAANLSALSR